MDRPLNDAAMQRLRRVEQAEEIQLVKLLNQHSYPPRFFHDKCRWKIVDMHEIISPIEHLYQ